MEADVQYPKEINSGENSPDKPRKRLNNPKQWKSNIRKTLRNSGKEYVSTAKKIVQARVLGRDCQCPRKCMTVLLSQQEQQKILTDFNAVGDYNLKKAHVFGCIQKKDIKRPRHRKNPNESRRTATYEYLVRGDARASVRVCRKAFLAVHGITDKALRVILKDLQEGHTTTQKDRRGLSAHKGNKVSNAMKQSVHEHIKSFPAQISHYSRKKFPNRMYLNAALNIKIMYRMYKAKCGENGVPCVRESMYRRIFKEKFNLGFGVPYIDTCQTCDMLRVSLGSCKDAAKRLMLKTELDLHLRKADKGYSTLREEIKTVKDQNLFHLVTFDMQKTLPTPNITTNVVFYKRQLWTYNVNMHSCNDDTSVMCMWGEQHAGRGSDEIGSCLYKTLNQNPHPSKKLIAYSDSCSGQNKNWFMVGMWSRLVKERVYNTIEHKFLVSGHTHSFHQIGTLPS